jgi:hypothetical protein
MYVVRQQQDEKYGNVVVLERQENGILSPFLALQQVFRQRRLWKESGVERVKLLIDGQIMTTSQAESWSREEYKSLPKCQECGAILSQDVYTHQFCDDNLFCSQRCADQNYHEKMEKIKDEEDSDL